MTEMKTPSAHGSLLAAVALGTLCHCSDSAKTASVPDEAIPTFESEAPDAPVTPSADDPESQAEAPTDSAAADDGIDEGGPDIAGIGETPEPDPPSSSDDAPPEEADDPAEMAPEETVPAIPTFGGPFGLGADISGVPEQIDGGAIFVDTDGTQKSILEVLANHGFNYVRLRTFVEPLAPFGYASCGKAEAYNDRDHVASFARQVKQANMRFLLDLHYSDTWADPGKQVIPRAWRDLTTIEELATAVHDYTVDVVQTMVDAGARPDMVQVGNEITPGMLIHVPTDASNCFGNNSVTSDGATGSTRNWDNLATLLQAGIEGVHEVDDTIVTMLHVENTGSAGGVINWMQNAQRRGVAFDVIGLSAYEQYQGPASAWPATFSRLAEEFPDLGIVVAEYNPQRTLLNEIVRDLPGGQGLGTFFWEPTRSGGWGQSIFNRRGNTYTANAGDFAEIDQIRDSLGR